MAVAIQSQNHGSVAGATSLTLPAWSPGGGVARLYLVACHVRSNRTITGVTGLGLTWAAATSLYQSTVSGSVQHGIQWWYAVGIANSTQVVISVSGTASNIIGQALEISGYDAADWLGNTAGAGTTVSNQDDDMKVDITADSGGMLLAAGQHRAVNFTVLGTQTGVDINRSVGVAGDAMRGSVWYEIVAGSVVRTMGGDNDLSAAEDWCMAVVDIKAAGGGTTFTQSFDASLSPSGSTAKGTDRAVAGAVDFAGDLDLAIARILDGAGAALTFTGDLGAIRIGIYQQAVAGDLTFTGDLAAVHIGIHQETLAGSLSFAGELTAVHVEPIAQAVAGDLSFAGALTLAVLTVDPTPYWEVLVAWDGVTYDDLSADARQLTWRRGSAGAFGNAAPGGGSILLHNGADRYVPFNPASPLYNRDVTGAPVLIRCLHLGTYYPVAAGYLRTVRPRVSYIPGERTAELVFEDAMARWQRREVTLAAQRAGINLEAARAAVMTALGVPGAQQSIAPESEQVIYGELVTIRDDEGEIVTQFEAGWTADALSLLEGLNAAALGRHFIRPGTSTSAPWSYVSVGRNHKLDTAPDATLVLGTDFDDLDGWEVGNETMLSRAIVRPVQPGDGSSVEAIAGTAGGNEAVIDSPRIPSLAQAQGVADHLQWRFRAERHRPRMLLQRRLPLMFSRDLFDVVGVTDERSYITARRLELVGIDGTWGPGPLPQVTWTLQDAPQQPTLTTYFVLGRDALGGSAILGR